MISGLKASIHNPNVSEEAKDRARHRLADLGDTKDLGHVISGLKASIHNPNVSEEAKDRARHRLADLANTSDASKEDRPVVEEFKLVEEVELVEQDVAEDEGGEKSVHQLGGFKATMHSGSSCYSV